MAQKLLGATTIGGGSAWAEDGGGGSQRSKILPHVTRHVRKNGEKTGGFTHCLAYKSPKTLFFTRKNRRLEEYISIFPWYKQDKYNLFGE